MNARLCLLGGILGMSQVAVGEINVPGVALNCFNCHANEGKAEETSIPSFKALSSEQLLQRLLDYKYDRQSATLMPRIAKAYSDAELQAIAVWLAQP